MRVAAGSRKTLRVAAIWDPITHSLLDSWPQEGLMAKAYWVVTYRSIGNTDAWAAYAKMAVSAIEKAGGRFIARGMPAKIYEAGMQQRVVLVEFDSLAKAIAAHDTAEYEAALKVLGNAVERD